MEKYGYAVLIIALFLVFLLSGLFSCVKTQAQQASDPEGIIMKNCTVCHNPQRICDNLGKMDKEMWNKTIKRMAGHGANIDPQNIPAAADYLAGLKPGSKPVCK